MKFISALSTILPIPGTLIEIRLHIVRNDMSFRSPQMYCMNIDLTELIIMCIQPDV